MLNRLLSNKNFTPTVISIIIIIFVSLIYFHPLLSGKKLQSSDVILVQGMNKNIENYRNSHNGEDALWSMSMFSGMPAYTIHVDYKGNVLLPIQRAINKILPNPMGLFILGMLSFFWLLRTMRVDVWLSLAGAIGFGLFSYHIVITEAGHGAKLAALMYCPAVLASIATAFRGKILLGASLLILTLGLELLTNHVQITYYLIFIVLLYGAYELYNHIKKGKIINFGIATALMSVAAGVAFFLCSSSLLPLKEYNNFSIRGTSELKVEPEQRDKGVTKDIKKSTGVDKDYAFNWSNGRDEIMTLIIPAAKGGSSSYKVGEKSELYKLYGEQIAQGAPMYWGTQPFTSGPTYAGAIVCFLFVLGLFLVKSELKWAIFFATVLFMFLSMGKNSYNLMAFIVVLLIPVIYNFTHKLIGKIPKNAYAVGLALLAFIIVSNIGGDPIKDYRLTDWFFDYLPLYNKFRAPASILGMVAITMPWLAFMGAQKIFDSDISKNEKINALFYAVGITGALLLYFAIMGESLYDFKSASADKQFPAEAIPSLLKDRASLLTSDAWRSLGFIIVAGGVLWAYASELLKNKAVVGGLIAGLVFLDLFFVDTRFLWKDGYVDADSYEQNFSPKEADQFIFTNYPNTKKHFRVFPASRNAFNDGSTPYYLNTIGGYNAAKIKRYQQLIEAQISKFNFGVINMLNTEFIIFDRQMPEQFVPLYSAKSSKEIVYKNEMNYGPAWIVNNIKNVNTPDEALYGLDSLNTYETALVEKLEGKFPSGFSTDSINRSLESVVLTSWDNRKMVYSYNSTKSRYVVFSEVYYPKGWTAKIDGKPASIYQTNFVLRGLVLPSGKHTIEFNYSPEILESSSNISRICSIILFLALAGSIFWEIKSLPPAASENGNKNKRKKAD